MKDENTINMELADKCARQFVRSKISNILAKYVGKPNADEAFTEINKTLVKDFIEIAKKETLKYFSELKSLMEI